MNSLKKSHNSKINSRKNIKKKHKKFTIYKNNFSFFPIRFNLSPSETTNLAKSPNKFRKKTPTLSGKIKPRPIKFYASENNSNPKTNKLKFSTLNSLNLKIRLDSNPKTIKGKSKSIDWKKLSRKWTGKFNIIKIHKSNCNHKSIKMAKSLNKKMLKYRTCKTNKLIFLNKSMKWIKLSVKKIREFSKWWKLKFNLNKKSANPAWPSIKKTSKFNLWNTKSI